MNSINTYSESKYDLFIEIPSPSELALQSVFVILGDSNIVYIYFQGELSQIYRFDGLTKSVTY